MQPEHAAKKERTKISNLPQQKLETAENKRSTQTVSTHILSTLHTHTPTRLGTETRAHTHTHGDTHTQEHSRVHTLKESSQLLHRVAPLLMWCAYLSVCPANHSRALQLCVWVREGGRAWRRGDFSFSVSALLSLLTILSITQHKRWLF